MVHAHAVFSNLAAADYDLSTKWNLTFDKAA